MAEIFDSTAINNLSGDLPGVPEDDIIHGGASGQTTGTGNDTLRGLGGNDTLYGYDGTDTLFGGTGNDTLYGGAGNDRLFGEAGVNEMVGGDGNDEITSVSAGDKVDGGAGLDRASVDRSGSIDAWIVDFGAASSSAGVNLQDGTELRNIDLLEFQSGSGDDLILGTDGDDTLYGGAGNDTIDGLGGNDVLFGEAGGDTIYGRAGDDYIDVGFDDVVGTLNTAYGGDGNDRFEGGRGIDSFFGEAGSDVFRGFGGADVMHGGDGDDFFTRISLLGEQAFGDGGNDTFKFVEDGSTAPFGGTIDGGAGIDYLENPYAGVWGDVDLNLSGQQNTSSTYVLRGIEQIYGLVGSAGNNSFKGVDSAAAGVPTYLYDDVVNGEGGDDSFRGGAGDDFFDGGPGDDTAGYSGALSAANYHVALNDVNGDGSYVTTQVQDLRPGAAEGTDTLLDVEHLEFAGQRYTVAEAVALTTVTNQPPQFTSPSSVSMGENETSVVAVAATDDGAAGGLRYSLVGGADQALFTLDAVTGALAFAAAPDYENPLDTGPNNVHELVIRATDDQGLFTDQATSVNVIDVVPMAAAATADGQALTGTSEGGDVLSDGGHRGVTINGAGNGVHRLPGGALTSTDTAVIDRSSSADGVVLQLDPAGGAGAFTVTEGIFPDRTLVASVTGIEKLHVIGSAARDVVWNNLTPGVITSLVIDAGAGDDQIDGTAGNDVLNGGEGNDNLIGFGGNDMLDGGAGNDWLQYFDSASVVDGGDGVDLAFTGLAAFDGPMVLDFRDAASASGMLLPTGATIRNVERVYFQAGSGAVQIHGGDGNDANDTSRPGDYLEGSSIADLIYGEGGDDQIDGGGGNDDLHGGTGDDSVVGNSGVDSLHGDDGNDRLIGLTGADVLRGGSGNDTLYGGSVPHPLHGTFDDATDVAVYGGALTAASYSITTAVQPDGQVVVTVSDIRAGGTEGTDTLFGIETLEFNGIRYTVDEAIALTAPQNTAPVITSNGGGATASLSVAENSTLVATVAASDSDLPAQPIAYSIVGGADASSFVIDAVIGALGFAASPDFENPNDVGANNVYEVVVQASDGQLADTQALSIAVSDVSASRPQARSTPTRLSALPSATRSMAWPATTRSPATVERMSSPAAPAPTRSMAATATMSSSWQAANSQATTSPVVRARTNCN